MSVYVDALVDYTEVARRRKLPNTHWCHLHADSHDELMAFARQMRLSPSWLQHLGSPSEHFDLTPSRRAWAIRLGAIEVSGREMGRRIIAARSRAQAQPGGEATDE